MDYQGNVIRPPSEARSIILQATVGCSHNRCTFCGAYKDVAFRIKDDDTVLADIAEAAAVSGARTLFLADGDVLSLGIRRLKRLLTAIREHLPRVRRVRLYANCRSLRGKSVDDLKELRQLGLDRVYLGLESGLDAILSRVRKGADARQMIEAGQKARAAGLFLSVSVLLGIGGTALSQEHAKATAMVLNRMQPRQIAALTLMPVPGTPLHDELTRGRFIMPDRAGLLRELLALVRGITLPRVQFQANHASNYLPIDCRLTRDKEEVCARVKAALEGRVPLMPEYMRGL